MQVDGTNYSQKEVELGYPEGIQYSYWHQARFKFLEFVLKRNGLTSHRLLDIGCGRGFVTRYLREKGMQAFGLEPSSNYEDQFDFIVYDQDPLKPSQDYAQNSKCLMLLDVLEHVCDRPTYLHDLASAYPNCEYLVLTVPARRELWSNFDEFYGHYLRYDLKTLSREAQAGGWLPIEQRYFFQLLYFPAWLAMKTVKKRSLEFKPVNRKSFLGLIHMTLGSALFVSSLILPRKWAGTSIIGVYKRPLIK